MSTKPNKKFVKTTNSAVSGAMSLMSLASKTKTTVASKDTKETVKATGEVSEAVDLVSVLDEKIKEMTDQRDAAKNVIKEFGKTIAIEYIKKTDRSKDSFVIESETGKTSLYGVQDNYKYSNLDEERIAYLQETYGEAVIATTNTFIVNPELIEKHGQKLCDFIQTCDEISDEDKANLIQLKQVHRIAKGTIHNLSKIAKVVKSTAEAMWEEFQPVQFIKERGKK